MLAHSATPVKVVPQMMKPLVQPMLLLVTASGSQMSAHDQPGQAGQWLDNYPPQHCLSDAQQLNGATW